MVPKPIKMMEWKVKDDAFLSIPDSADATSKWINRFHVLARWKHDIPM